jgi:LacI family transcriptional regulator
MAARLLVEEARSPDQHRHRHVVFKPELVVRESSALNPDRHRDKLGFEPVRQAGG